MTPRERVLTVLRGGKPDRVPWVPEIGESFFRSLPEYRARFDVDDFTILREDQVWDALKFRIEFFRSIGADFLYWYACGGWLERLSLPTASRVQMGEDFTAWYMPKVLESNGDGVS